MRVIVTLSVITVILWLANHALHIVTGLAIYNANHP